MTEIHRQTNQPSLFEVEVLPLYEEHRADWLERARATGEEIARRKGSVTINDVRDACPPPAGVDPRVMGAVLATKRFVAVGYERSSRKECHNRPIAIFKLAGV